jgi:hypothetical protein
MECSHQSSNDGAAETIAQRQADESALYDSWYGSVLSVLEEVILMDHTTTLHAQPSKSQPASTIIYPPCIQGAWESAGIE